MIKMAKEFTLIVIQFLLMSIESSWPEHLHLIYFLNTVAVAIKFQSQWFPEWQVPMTTEG